MIPVTISEQDVESDVQTFRYQLEETEPCRCIQTFPPAASARNCCSSTTMADPHRHSTASPEDADAIPRYDGAGNIASSYRTFLLLI